MDFRCDQSRGIHFIYLLPYSPAEALVRSTMLSTKRQSDEFYAEAIKTTIWRLIGRLAAGSQPY